MATFNFDLVSPEKLVFSGQVDQVDVPGSEGDLGVLAGHAPFVTTVRPGILTIYREGAGLKIVVDGGFAEANPEGLTVLADMAVGLGGFDPGGPAGQNRENEEDVADTKEPWPRAKTAPQHEQPKTHQKAPC